MIFIYQTYYNAHTKSFCDPDLYPYENKVQDEYFENTVIRNIYESTLKLKGMEYIGVLSWKQLEKTHITGKEMIAHIQKDIRSGTAKDIYLPSPIPDNNNLILTSNYPEEPRIISGRIKGPDGWMEHKIRNERLYECDKLLNDSGVLPANLFDGKWQYSKCNYWIVRRHVFNDYLQNWLIPAMDYFKNVEHTLPSYFSHSSGRSITPICFTLEYLFGSFLGNSGYSFEYLVKKRYHGIRNRQWVKITGFENTNPLIEKPKHKHHAHPLP